MPHLRNLKESVFEHQPEDEFSNLRFFFSQPPMFPSCVLPDPGKNPKNVYSLWKQETVGFAASVHP